MRLAVVYTDMVNIQFCTKNYASHQTDIRLGTTLHTVSVYESLFYSGQEGLGGSLQ